MKLPVIAVAGLMSAGMMASANAAAVTFAKDLPADAQKPAVEQVHFRHSSCQLGPRGWHYHFRGERRSCERRPGLRFWTWRCDGPRCDWWHSRERRWR